jgi:hypothetical protein
MNTPVKAPLTCLSLLALLLLPVVRATAATSDDTPRQSYDDAWWTGPLLASGASALPHGHYLIEPYLYDVVVRGVYDSAGEKHTVAREDGLRSLTYLLYGLTDATTVGLIPRFGYNASGHGTHSSGPQIGDLTLHAHHQFLKFREGHWPPALSVVLEQTLPTGKYDRLGSNPGDGLGAGVFATTFALYMQRYFWVPNGRIVRTRLDVAYTRSGGTHLEDISVYGTRSGFSGSAQPGDSINVDSSWEYSATRSWVLALDITYQRDASTHVLGRYGITPFEARSGVATTWSLAPAVEYSWNGNMGVIAGAKVVVAGRNTGAVVVPAVAINMVF